MNADRQPIPRQRHFSGACRRWALLAVAVLFLTGLASPATAQRELSAPEPGTGREQKNLATAHRHMVVAAHPLAAAAGLEMLRNGGSAIDAAIAVQLVLGLVEPQSSGLGGGAFLLHWDAARRTIETFDGRETAPAAARPDRFPPQWRFESIIPSGLSIGVPGVPRLLEEVHKQHGRLPWSQLFGPAIRLAEQGFPVSRRLHLTLSEKGAEQFTTAARRYFFAADASPHPIGHLLSNPEYAATLRALATDGADAFYRGPIAATIIAAAQEAPFAPSDMTLEDLASYTVKARPPLCFEYRSRKICSMGPPSSGGPALAQILGLLEPFDLGGGPYAAMRPRALHVVAEAQKLAYADRNRYLGDPDFVTVPYGYSDPAYLAKRRMLITKDRAMPRPVAGDPPAAGRQGMGEDSTVEAAGTSHISIVDSDGNAVAMTTTIEAAFGSRVWAAGFLLNNQLTDFALRPVDATGAPAANAVAAGKRPRSSMAPTLVFDRDGRLSAVLGSPGGSRIILYVAKALIALIDWRMDAQSAASLPNFGSQGGVFEMEAHGAAILPALALSGYGHAVRFDGMTSGLHILTVRPGRLEGGVDPRREGVAVGD